MAMTNVTEATVFIMEVTKVGDVYFKLEKYMFRVKLPLHMFSYYLKKTCWREKRNRNENIYILTPEVTARISLGTA